VRNETEARTALVDFARAQAALSTASRNEPEGPVTMQSCYEAYVARRKVEGKSTDRARWVWAVLCNSFNHMRPVDITAQACREYAAMRAGLGKKPNTIYDELSVLRAIVNGAARAKLIPADDKPDLWVPPMPEPRDRHLTRAELAKLIAATELPHVRLFIILAIATAARKTAILQLTWERVDFDRGLIYLRDPNQPATTKSRPIVPMNVMARSALDEARKGAISDYVVEWAGGRIKNIKRAVSTALNNAGLKVKQDGAHLLRHSAAVLMAESGVPIPEIGQYLGHSDLKTTYRIYARYSPDYLKSAASALNLDLSQPKKRVTAGSANLPDVQIQAS
jgi:integrase